LVVGYGSRNQKHVKEKNEELGTGSDPDPVLSGHREKERDKAKAHKTQKKANQTATEKNLGRLRQGEGKKACTKKSTTKKNWAKSAKRT
jgi:hypothetical protein